MAQYIDKAAVVAEIERIKKEECPTDSYEGRCKLLWFEQFLSFLDTLETKEVNLEEEIKNILNQYYYFPEEAIDTPTIIRITARHFYELGLRAKDVNEIIKTAEDHAYFAGSENTREKLIEKACKWWEDNFTYPTMTSDEIEYYKSKIEVFRKAMEE